MKRLIYFVLALVMTVTMTACSFSSDSDYLVLVNKENPIDTEYVDRFTLETVDTVYDDLTAEVETETYEAYLKLQDILEEKGVEIGIDSAYRSIEKQQQIMDDFIKEYGEEYAKATVAEPGTSEHHTALVIDIVPKVDGEWVVENEDMLKEKEVFSIIHENLAECGFIVRYPEGKEEITGYDYEPWHIRYVGEKAAKEIYESGITLEEYLDK